MTDVVIVEALRTPVGRRGGGLSTMHPAEILALTFTREAAIELRARAEELLGTSHETLRVTTFHSYALELNRIHGVERGLLPATSVARTEDRMLMLLDRLDELDLRLHDLRGDRARLVEDLVIYGGKVVKIDPNIDPVTRTFTTYVEIKNDDFRLKPGLSGFARIRRSAKDVLAVPSIAILNPSGEQASVFVVDDSGHANMLKIRPGIVVDAMTEVTDGLKEGEKVVTVGQLYLNNNDKVRTTERSLSK